MTNKEKTEKSRGMIARTLTMAEADVKLYNADTDSIETVHCITKVSCEVNAEKEIARNYTRSGNKVIAVHLQHVAERFVGMKIEKFIELADINEEC